MNIQKIIKELHYYGNINFNKLGNDLEISIRIIKSCNEKCMFCSTDLDNKIIEFGELIILIKFFIKAYGNKYNLLFVFTGGEPTLYPNLDRIISLVMNKGYRVKLETNATIFSNEEYVKKFKVFKGNIIFFISFHSHIKDIYNKITNSHFYNDSIKGIKNLFNHFGNDFVELNCVINNLNFEYLEGYLDFISNNFYINNKVQLVFSMLLANKENYEKFLVKYSTIVPILYELYHSKYNDKIDISNDGGGYTHLPFCILSKIKFIDLDNILKHASPLDKVVGNNIMYKSIKCNKCDFNNCCIGISKKYYNKFGDSELFPLLINY